MLRAGVIGICALAFLAAWAWVLPPADTSDIARRADGSIVNAGHEVTRAAPRAPVLPIPGAADLAMLESSVEAILDALGIPKHDAEIIEVAQNPATSALSDMVASALRDGQGNAAIKALVNAAYARDEIEVPDVLLTARKTIDTDTLLTIVLSRAKARLGEADTTLGFEVVTYVVQPGDSLAGIALYAFGDAWQSPRLIAANPNTLPSAAALFEGQVLTIPSD